MYFIGGSIVGIVYINEVVMNNSILNLVLVNLMEVAFHEDDRC